MKKAVATIAGNPPQWVDVTVGRMRDYATRTGAELVVLEPKDWHGAMDKQLLRDVVASFDRALLLDFDVVVSRLAPSVFDLCADEAVWMTLDTAPGEPHCWIRGKEMVTSQAMLGSLCWTSGYGNSGVIVASRQHAEAWSGWIEIPSELCEQTNLNYRIRQLGMKVGWLHRNWNSMGINNGLKDSLESCEALACDAFIVHTAGFSWESREEAIPTLDRLLP
jgi:hypothetical protein